MTMNILKTSILLAATLLFSGAALAQTQVKIASVRVDEMILQSPVYKSLADKMKLEFERRKTELDAQIKTFQEDAKKFQRDAEIMSPDERAKKEKELSARQVDLQYAQQKFKEDASARDRELTQDLLGKVKLAIDAVAKEKGLDLIVRDPLYAVPAVDITDDVLKRLQANTAAAAAAPAKK